MTIRSFSGEKNLLKKFFFHKREASIHSWLLCRQNLITIEKKNKLQKAHNTL